MESINHEIFAAWLQQRSDACKARQAALAADDRSDEAVFERIRANVFEIFHTVWNVGWKTAAGDPQKAQNFFAGKLEQIPQNWHSALASAEAHDDVERATVERLKLEALAEIRTYFAQPWKE